MKSIDAEIFQVEQRLAMRKVALADSASRAKQRAVKRVTSPAMLVGAVALGLLAAGIARKRRAAAPAPDRRKANRERGKGLALGTFLMTGASWFIRSQFGGPAGLAQFVLSKVRERRAPATAAPAQIHR